MPARLSQHFLVDPSAAEAIVRAADIGAQDEVLEIGPGRGALTGLLTGRAKRVCAVEKDEKLARALAERPALKGKVEVIIADFLAFDLTALGPGPFKIVANLPYAVAAPILQKLLSWPCWSAAVLMFQKEMARRILSGPGSRDYGILALSVLPYAQARFVLEVSKEGFSPRPKVDSSVLRLGRRADPLLSAADREAFFRVVRAAFSQRRKMVAGPLAHGLGLPAERVRGALSALGISSTARAETIPFESYLRLPGLLGL